MKTIVFVIAALLVVGGLSFGGVRVGGYSEQEAKEGLNSPKLRELVLFGLKELRSRDNSIEAQELIPIKLVSYHTQVVAGINHKITLECEINNKSKYTVELVIYERPWENVRELTSYTLQN
eukprot:TRINITY_DN155_c0_g1_i1.p1 TRINITY_DN155_c0_g1~~TRINITY_DN155_c0_g1_i1.p1  ORF type:complete len:121 (+),score=38.62 TRINITY_DN155_c0_g1_i1:146-508(+)